MVIEAIEMNEITWSEWNSDIYSFIEPDTAVGAGAASVNKTVLDPLLLELSVPRQVLQSNR